MMDDVRNVDPTRHSWCGIRGLEIVVGSAENKYGFKDLGWKEVDKRRLLYGALFAPWRWRRGRRVARR